MQKRVFIVAILSVLAGVVSAGDPDFTWGGRPAHPAVVNPVMPQENIISLRGEWEFVSFPVAKPFRNGIWTKMFKEDAKFWKDRRTIRVPGCWEEQGVGEPGDSVPWDATWDHNAKPISHKLMGECWYRRDVEIPADWKGRRIWIKLGGIKNVGWVWVNGRQVALVDNYCATEKYEITDLVEPGKTAKVVIEASNLRPSRKGLLSAMHRWGGIYRDVELEATPSCFIDDAWVRGDFDRQVAEVHVEIEGIRDQESGVRVRATVEGETKEAALHSSPSTFTLEVPLRNFRSWSPAHPNLYTAKVELVENGRVVQTRWERFGVRKIEVRGRDFYLNGKPFFIRGFGDDHVYPISGITPADRDVHRVHLAKARAAGFNYVRLHTHCEVPEYFEAADELGIMIQPELPYYSDLPVEGFEFDPKRDVTELWKHYRRHPSFTTYSMGNEGAFGDSLDVKLHKYVKAMDPDRLKINQDGNCPSNSSDRSDFCSAPPKPWPRGTFVTDSPAVTHEYLNLSIKLDSRTEPKFTGTWAPPATRKARADWLARFGLDHEWGDRLQDAQHVLQGIWQKRGIESARSDPHCDGYIFWTIVDVVVWNAKAEAYSAQGLFNPFWEDKSHGFSAGQFAAFNSPSCVLADFTPSNSVFCADDTLQADILMAHYGDEALKDAVAKCSIVAGGDVLAAKGIPVGDVALGGVRKLCEAKIGIPAVAKPVKATFCVDVGGVANSWDIWLFPKQPSREEILREAGRRGVVIAGSGTPEAKAALAQGRNLVTIDGADGEPNISLGWWWMGEQVGTAIRNHPALGDFPHDGFMTPLMFRLVNKKGLALPADGIDPKDMIIVGEGGEKCFLYLAERRMGKSRVLECHGLSLLSDTPEANALLRNLTDYLAGR